MKIQITADLRKPATHYIHVRYVITEIVTDELVFSFPVWSPGSYLVRDYQSQVESFSPSGANGRKLPFDKVSKNQWKIHLQGSKRLVLDYRIYTQELNVRSCYLDHRLAFFNPTAAFFHPEGELHRPVSLKVLVPRAWKIAGPLKKGDVFHFENFDDFYDAPFMAAPDLEMRAFKESGVAYRIAFWGEHHGDTARIQADVRKIVREQIRMFKGHPCQDYLFQILFVKGQYGGLEHGHSSSNLFDGTLLHDDKGYRQLLALLSHEHFHLWNVKRIRPAALGPFDYSKEAYTKDLWIAEGITSYYDDLFVYRAGLFTKDQYLEVVAENIKKYENQKSKETDSLSTSSFDAWIRFYRPNDNTPNVVMSYYLKGGLVTMLLDGIIRDATSGRKSMDDVMRLLYRRYLKNPAVGITREEFAESVIDVLPGFNWRKFEKDFINGTSPLPWKTWLLQMGLEFKPQKKKHPHYFGLVLQKKEGKVMIRSIAEGGPAYGSSLRAGDELLAMNGERMESEKDLDWHLKGKEVKVLFARFGRVHQAELKLVKNELFDAKLGIKSKSGARQRKILKSWL